MNIIKENEAALAKGGLSMKEFGKVVAQNTELQAGKQELLKQKSEQKEQKSGFDKKQTAIFEDIRKNIFKISDSEMKKRKAEDEEIRIAQEGLDLLKNLKD